MIKELWRKAASQGADFWGGQLAAAVPLSCRYWWLNDPFCCVHAAKTPNAFQWAGQVPKLSLPEAGSRPHLIRGSLSPHERTLNGISIGLDLAVFTTRRYASTLYAVVVSVCQSQAGTVPKWLNAGHAKRKQHRTIAQRLLFSDAKDLGEIPTGSPPNGGAK